MPTEARPALAFYLGRATFCPLLGQFCALGRQRNLSNQPIFTCLWQDDKRIDMKNSNRNRLLSFTLHHFTLIH